MQNMIDYGKLVDEAMHVIVGKVMKIIEQKGLPGNHHFFISFITKFPGVKISKNLLNKYPREMTIVLQYQFQDLIVENKGFGVTLSFGGSKENIYIPYAAITTFADPSVQFGLQFRESNYDYHEDMEIQDDEIVLSPEKTKATKSTKKASKEEASNNVVSLDKFRKKK
jgi:hypothetical protein